MNSASNASHALGVQAVQILDAVRSQRVRALESLLDQVGLQRRRGLLRPVLFVVAGAAAAGAVVLVLAPTSGKGLRAKVVDLFRSAKDQVRANMGEPQPTAFEKRVDRAVGDSSGSSGSIDGVSRPYRAGDQSQSGDQNTESVQPVARTVGMAPIPEPQRSGQAYQGGAR